MAKEPKDESRRNFLSNVAKVTGSTALAGSFGTAVAGGEAGRAGDLARNLPKHMRSQSKDKIARILLADMDDAKDIADTTMKIGAVGVAGYGTTKLAQLADDDSRIDRRKLLKGTAKGTVFASGVLLSSAAGGIIENNRVEQKLYDSFPAADREAMRELLQAGRKQDGAVIKAGSTLLAAGGAGFVAAALQKDDGTDKGKGR